MTKSWNSGSNIMRLISLICPSWNLNRLHLEPFQALSAYLDKTVLLGISSYGQAVNIRHHHRMSVLICFAGIEYEQPTCISQRIITLLLQHLNLSLVCQIVPFVIVLGESLFNRAVSDHHIVLYRCAALVEWQILHIAIPHMVFKHLTYLNFMSYGLLVISNHYFV